MRLFRAATLLCFLIILALFYLCRNNTRLSSIVLSGNIEKITLTPKQFVDTTFDVSGVLEESDSMETSASQALWLNSGALFTVESGVGRTVYGDLPQEHIWRKKYSRTNSLDTDHGYHPQNIFRLITRTKYLNVQQQAYFKIKADHFSASPNRNESNGLLLFNRYVDDNNLFYAGIRVDGLAVIKKKVNGKYVTLAQTPVQRGKYSRSSNTNFIPHNTWLGIKTEVMNDDTGSVRIKLFLDMEGDNSWQLVLETEDSTKVLSQPGFGGIRTDFMDVEFKEYQIRETDM